VRTFRPDIEGLRALAVALVVLYHAGVPFLPGGYVGVDVFFVISGYLITSHLLAPEHRSLARFYARRVRRLLPLAAVVTVVTLAATWLLTSALETRQLGTDAVWAALFGMNLHLAQQGVDYQAADQDASALQHFWSLAVEEQFYLVWPLLLLLIRGRRKACTIGVLVVTSVSFVYGVHETEQAKALAYFLTPCRAWELGVGALIALAERRIRQSRWGAETLAVAGLLAIGASAALLDDASAFPGYLALFPVLGTAGVVVAGLRRVTGPERLLFARAPVQGLGRISYGLYLWHWPVLVLAPAYLGVERLSLPQGLAAVVVAMWIAAGTYFVLEDPLRRLPGLTGRPRPVLLLGTALTVVVAGAGAASSHLVADPLGDGAAAQVLDDGTDLAQAIRVGAALRAVPSNLEPAPAEAALDEPGTTIRGAAACHVNIQVTRLSTDPRDYCVFGDPHGARTVVLTGDSHAYQWLPTLVELAARHDWRLVSLTKAACPLYDVPLVNQTLNRDYTECYRWRRRALERIRRERPAMVVTSGAVFNPRPGLTPRWVAGVARTVTALRAGGARVVVLADTPFPGHDVPACLAAHLDDARVCRLPVEEGLTDPARRAGTATAAERAGATVVNPLRWLCGRTGCPAIIGNTLVYRDNSHLTATYARYLAPWLDSAIGPVVSAGAATGEGRPGSAPRRPPAP
jgi:peptidoglycan/LPS O-acetylase OafA/YrhL